VSEDSATKNRKDARLRKREQRKRDRERKKAQEKISAELALPVSTRPVATNFESQEALSKKEAKECLRESRSLTQPYIINAAYEMGIIAARRLKLTPSEFYWSHGVLSTLESIRAGEPTFLLPAVQNKKAYGEVFREQDLLALWDFSTSWREQKDGARFSFEEYKTLRALKGDTIQFGNRLLGKEFEPAPHGEWAAFFPQLKIDVLPENYTQKEFKEALAKLESATEGPLHAYLLMAARNSFKTSFIICYLLCFVCCFFDIQIMFASATTPLSKDTVKSFKDFFRVENEDPTLFQQIFAETCLFGGLDDGSVLTYECPAARLHLAQPTAFAVGLDSTVSGRRCTVLCSDDLSDNTNSDTPELRISTQRKFELMAELLNPEGMLFMCGTPYAQGDLLFTALERNDKNTEKSLAVRIDPAFTILDETRRREVEENPQLLYTLQNHEVKELFPSRLSFEFLMRKLNNVELKTFRQQQLLQFTADGEGNIRLNFESERLWANVIEPDQIPPNTNDTQIILSVDRAHSTKPWADRSSLSVVKFHLNKANQPSMCVLFNEADRWATSILAKRVVNTAIEYKVSLIILEQDPAWRDLRDAIQLECEKQYVTFEMFWRPVTHTPKIKIIRFKALEGCLNADPSRLTFVRGPWVESLFGEFLWQDGIRTSTNKQKDDRLDTLGQAHLILPSATKTEESESVQQAREQAQEQQNLRQLHEMYFGSGSTQNVSTGRDWRYGLPSSAPPPDNTRYLDDSRGLFGIPGLRGAFKGKSQQPRKLMSFGDIQPKRKN
jgi:hypothetical protein